MPSAGDRADDEFVFVVNKAVNSSSSSSSSSSSFQSAAFASASKSSLTSSPVLFPKHRPAPRLNHLRPIPTSLGDCPTVSAAPEHLTHGSHTHPPLSLTATKAVATPLPPELLELLPPHLREKSTSSSWKDEVPRRPPLPYDFSLGDYSNVEDDSAPVAGAHAKERNVVSRSQSFTARETYKPVNGRSPLHNGKPQSPLSELESSIADLVSPLKNSSSYLNHSGTPLIKNTSSSPSSTSLKKATTVNGVPSFPPSPKFSRSTAASSTAVANAHPTNSTASGVKADPSSLTQVSYTAVLASDGEKAQFYRRLEAVTPTPAPFLNSFRASGSGSHHQASSSSHSRASPKPSGTSTPVSSPRSGSEPSNKNGGVKSQGSSSPVSDLRSARGQGPSRRTTPSSNSPRSSSPLSATGSSPTRRSCSRTEGVTSTSPSSSSSFPVVNGYSSSQDMDKAWNIVGVPPVSSSPQGFPSGSVHGSQSPVNRNWRTASPPVALHTSPSHSNYPDGDSIYDNLTVHPVRPQPIVACSAPSVPPCLANGFAPPPASPTAHLGARSPTPTSSISLSRPGTPAGKPPSPPMQRRAGSRSPTPHQRQKPQPQPLPQQQLRSHVTTPPPTGAHFVAPVPHTYFVPVDRGVGGDGGGYWAAAGSGMYGSSPQLCPPGGGAVPVYCQYVYSPHPYGFLPFDGRAHSCERLAGDPVLVAAAPAATATAAVPVVHPASSPRVGRRSVSPCLQQNALPVQPGAPAPVGFRSSSCSPVPGQRRSGTRHSPSPDPGGATGKPPRPRRPHPVRKAKTVEVGYLGQGVSSTGAPSPTSTSSKVLVSPTAHVSVPAPAHASPAGVKVPSFETLHQQIRECSQAPPKRDAKQATSVFHDSLREERELLIKLRQKQKEQLEQLEQLKLQERKRQEQAASDGGKGKVTYKRSLYKCMKNWLKS